MLGVGAYGRGAIRLACWSTPAGLPPSPIARTFICEARTSPICTEPYDPSHNGQYWGSLGLMDPR